MQTQEAQATAKHVAVLGIEKSFFAWLHFVADLHEFFEPVHREQVPKFLVRINQHELAFAIAQEFKETQYLSNSRAIDERDILEIDDHLVDVPLEDGFQPALQGRTMFKS